MGKGKYENIANADDYSFADPTGRFMGQLDNFNEMASFGREGMQRFTDDPNMAFNAFMGQAGGLSDLAMGETSKLTGQLNQIASQQASEGIQHMGTQFAGQGARHSGAAARAMGEAASNPFAQVAAQQQQNQLNLTGGLWNQAFGGQQQLQQLGAQLYGGVYGQGMQGAGQMASQTAGLVAPQYEYQKGFGDRLGDVAGFGLNLATAGGSLGWQPFGKKTT